MIDDLDERKLRRILEVISQVKDCVERNDITEEQILDDRDTQWMLSMPLAEIGEQVYALSKEFKQSHPEGEWSYISGMRHRLVHNYEGISFAFVAEAVFTDLADLAQRIESILEAECPDSPAKRKDDSP